MDQTLPLKLTVYSKPNCVQCTATKKWLDQRNINYQIFDVSENEQALEVIKDLGYLQVPVVVVPFNQGPTRHFSGFNPLELAQIQA